MARYLFLSTPVGPLGSGAGGGVELNLINLAQELTRQGDQVDILAPSGSVVEGIRCFPVTGLAPQYTQTLNRDAAIELAIPSVLANLCELALDRQHNYDLIVNWAYDWLPYYLTPFFQTPIVHVVSMGSMTDALDWILRHTLERFPGRVAVHSKAQAATFKFAQAQIQQGQNPFFILPCGIDPQQYQFVSEAQGPVCWIGRISPEKGLEDCAAVAQRSQIPVNVLGRMQDVDYWHQIRQRYPKAPLTYRGFLPTPDMQQILGQSRAMLMTPKWIEAFGMVVVEALACGVPVITYRRGGPAEIVIDGQTGWIVDPDNISQLEAALQRIDHIDRHCCRQWVETHYSLTAMAHHFKTWTDPMCSTDRIN